MSQLSKLQFFCLEALKDMTLKQLNKKYFEDGGIGYTMNVVGGKACPVDFIVEDICKRFPKKYHTAWQKEEEYRASYKGW